MHRRLLPTIRYQSLLFYIFCLCACNAWCTLEVFAEEKIQAPGVEEYKGHLVVVDFWASWCASCQISLPGLNDLANRFKEKGLKVVAVNLDKKKENADELLATMHPTFDVKYDPYGFLPAQYNVSVMPSSYLISREGLILSSYQGSTKEVETRREHDILQALEEKK